MSNRWPWHYRVLNDFADWLSWRAEDLADWTLRKNPAYQHALREAIRTALAEGTALGEAATRAYRDVTGEED